MLTTFKTIIPKILSSKNPAASTKTREFLYIKVIHVLKIKTGHFHSPAETTDINNSSDLVFLQKWKNQAFSRCFSSHKKSNHVFGRKIILLDLQAVRALFKLNCSQVFHSPEHITINSI